MARERKGDGGRGERSEGEERGRFKRKDEKKIEREREREKGTERGSKTSQAMSNGLYKMHCWNAVLEHFCLSLCQ